MAMYCIPISSVSLDEKASPMPTLPRVTAYIVWLASSGDLGDSRKLRLPIPKKAHRNHQKIQIIYHTLLSKSSCSLIASCSAL